MYSILLKLITNRKDITMKKLYSVTDIAESRGMLNFNERYKIGTATRKLGLVPVEKIGVSNMYDLAQCKLIEAELDRIADKS